MASEAWWTSPAKAKATPAQGQGQGQGQGGGTGQIAALAALLATEQRRAAQLAKDLAHAHVEARAQRARADQLAAGKQK